GARVETAGPISQTQITDAEGLAHFADLPAGPYAVSATFQALPRATVNNVSVVSGESTRVAIVMCAAGASESATPAATPTANTKPASVTSHLTADDLGDIPNARDPWALLQTVPTIYLDRVNVGGAESGQQSNYNAKGAV